MQLKLKDVSGKQTTVNIEEYLLDMMALRLGYEPENKEPVKAWLQELLLNPKFYLSGADDKELEMFLKYQIFIEIADPALKAKYDSYMFDNIEELEE